MPLTTKEAFKVAFLARCVEDRLTPDEMLERVKSASAAFEKDAILGTLVDKGLGALQGTASALGHYGIPLAIAAPPVLGGMAGYGLAKMTDIDDTDVSEIQNRELVDEYRRQAEGLRNEAAARRGRSGQGPGRRVF